MNKVRHRAAAVLVLAALIVAGVCLYVIRFIVNGDEWAGAAVNGNAFVNGRVAVGTITDRNGLVLAEIQDGARVFAEDASVRKASLHIVGDRQGNIGTGALKQYTSRLLGYNPITGIYSLAGNGGTVELSIDARLNVTALEALNGRSGVVAVMNYRTGEILCEVSSPTFDPSDPPEIDENDTSGVYINRFLSSAYTPGSVFKLVTLAAAIENIPDLYDRDFYCDGSVDFGGDTVSCTGAHGSMKIEDALAVSCNCTFAGLAVELGAGTIERYASAFGLTSSQSVDMIATADGRYDYGVEDIDIAWSGVGQYNDAVNPAAMLRFVAAIANDGAAVEMTQLKTSKGSSDGRLLSAGTAEKIASMMNYCVTRTYGSENFPGLELHAKSGTAEVGNDRRPNAWFVGFIDNEDAPLAFVVVIEEGGWGSSAAGEVANKVLQEAVFG